MASAARYELIEPIAKGDFATVFRARDGELGREVAVKQIHQQYLDDPAQLERYWQEAQLLATLDHPYIMTIYDVVRDRGWLILELMQGSLQQQLDGKPIDLEDLRLTMMYTLSALQFLHENGIVHGDVKPGNLLLDKNHRVKLGDFGIARRIAGDDGSVVKGTTKYMAPEVLSDQFGEVGPHSDIYSLGFSAYELMCGEHFESLFPGLNMYGRDPQVAWMMWQSAPDRRLPEIEKVLQGVPADMAAVIEKMCEKDPAKRYKSAEKPLKELRARGDDSASTETAEEVAAAEQQQRQARNKRMMAIGAFAFSLVFSVLILIFTIGGGPEPPKKPPEKPIPSSGTIELIHADTENPYLLVREPGKEKPVEVDVDPDSDIFLVNRQESDFGALKVGDEIEIKRLQTEEGKPILRITATQAKTEQLAGQIAQIDRDRGIVSVAVEGQADPLKINVLASTSVQLNRAAASLGDLKTGDRVAVEHLAGDDGRVAKSLSALRRIELQGFVDRINSAQETLTIRLGEEADSPKQTLQLAKTCAITINAAASKGGQKLTLAHLRADDRITISHDAEVHSVAAVRGLAHKGPVRGIDAAKPSITVGDVEFALAEDCEIHIAGSDTVVDLGYFRLGDEATVSHESFDLKSPVASQIEVVAPADPRGWAIVISDEAQRDNGGLIADALATYYRVPPTQLLRIEDADTAKLKEKLPQFLLNVPAGAQLIVYFAGSGKIEGNTGYVLDGLEWKWLIGVVEGAAAGRCLLLLDTCHGGEDPSAQQLAETRNGAGLPVSEKVTVVASCKKEETGLAVESGASLLANFAAQALRGAADVKPRDHRVYADELFAYVDSKMRAFTGPDGAHQTPHLFLPDRVPRLRPEVKTAVEEMLAAKNLNSDEFKTTYEIALAAAGEQPDVEIAYGMLLLELAKDSKGAFQRLQGVREAHPEAFAACPASAWLNFVLSGTLERVEPKQRAMHLAGVADLVQMVKALPNPIAEPPPGPEHAAARGAYARQRYVRELMVLAGALREFAVDAAEPRLQFSDVKPLDDFFLEMKDGAPLRPVALEAYKRGMGEFDAVLMRLDQDIEAADTQVKKDLLIRSRKRVVQFLNFNFDAAADLLRAQMDD